MNERDPADASGVVEVQGAKDGDEARGAFVDLSIVIVSYNVRDLLLRCVRSIAETTRVGALTVQTIVVDNASTDGSIGALRESGLDAECIEVPTNEGFSAAVNRGAARATGTYLLLLNPDTELPDGALEHMVARLQARQDVDALGVRQVDEHGFFQLAVGPGPSLFAELMRKLLQGRLDNRDPYVAAAIDRMLRRPMTVPWVAGSCLMTRRSAFDAVDGFDEGFFLYFEDIDFCLRLAAAGHSILYDPTITIVHHRGASAAGVPEQAQAAYRESQLRFWDKHRGPWARRLVAAYLAARGQSPDNVGDLAAADADSGQGAATQSPEA